ncbi:hypothetical protein D3C72_1568130 [compost metagenome]
MQNLLYPQRRSKQPGQIVRNAAVNFDFIAPNFIVQQRPHPGPECAQRDGLIIDSLTGQLLTKLLQQCVGALDLNHGGLKQLRQLFGVLLPNQTQGRLVVTQNRGEGLVKFMHDTGGQFAQGIEPCDFGVMGTQIGDISPPTVGSILVNQVKHQSPEQCRGQDQGPGQRSPVRIVTGGQHKRLRLAGYHLFPLPIVGSLRRPPLK